MPRPKKVESDVAVGSSYAAETNADQIAGIAVRWEWEGDGNKWTAYADEHSALITAAHNAKQKVVTLDTGKGVQLQVIFEKLVQKNGATGWERRIRCCVLDGCDYFCWQWEDEKSQWHPYAVDNVVALEKSHVSGETSIDITACKRTYTVELKTMQQKNKTTGVARNVQRLKSVAMVTPSAVKTEGSVAAAPTTSAASTSRGSGAKRAAAAAVPDEGMAEPATKKAKTVSGKSASGKSAGRGDAENTVKTVVVKGKAPVDPECHAKCSVAHVYYEGKDVYDAMLNQTNVGNNNNKYYLLQLLEDDGRKSYNVWFRWGRVGFRGQNSLVACGPDLDEAKKVFCKKFTDKTKKKKVPTATLR